VPRRWDGDERGRGVADASALADGARDLLEAMVEPDWVAEEPEAHLLPHLRRACEQASSALQLEHARVEDDGSLFVALCWRGEREDRGGARAAAYSLIGQVAEAASYVRERREGDAVVYEVATGMLPSDTSFAPHGHVLTLRISPAVA
jgi:hypothetical protein